MKIDVSIVIWTVVNFTVFMLLLNRFLFKPLLKFMDERQKRIDDGISAGEQAKRAMEESERELGAALGKRRHDEMMRAEETAAQALAAAQERSARERAEDDDRRVQTRHELEREAKELLESFGADSDMLIAALADKLLAEEV